ncbi:hypothetical protein CDV36_016463, partial [Fusarium kuroshium]
MVTTTGRRELLTSIAPGLLTMVAVNLTGLADRPRTYTRTQLTAGNSGMGDKWAPRAPLPRRALDPLTPKAVRARELGKL